MTARRYPPNPVRDPARPWAPSPFGRLARTHALSIVGDAVFTTAMAGLVFFSVAKLNDARWQVGAALLFTIVPFSIAAPFLGPLIDRAKGGRKWMIVGLCLARAVVCFLLVLDRDNHLLMYPQFTLVLVFAQGYVLARGALVPATVHNDEELIEANSKLAAISGVAAVAGGATSLSVMWIVSKFGTDRGPNVALAIAVGFYVAATVQALQLPAVRVADAPADEAETTELHGPGILHAAAAISFGRVVVGFLTFLLAFHFKGLEETDVWASRVGLAGSVIAAQVGFLTGSFIAVRVRRAISEEQMILIALSIMAVAGILTSVMSVLAGALLMALAVGLTSNAAKQAFDSIVQRDAPDANRGRAFAKFETRFQLWWVLGALAPVVIPDFSPHLGFLLIAIGTTVGAVWFGLARRRLLAESKRRPSPLAGEPVLVEPRPVSRSFLRGGRAATEVDAPAAVEARTGFGGDDPTMVGPGEGTALLPVPAPSATTPGPAADRARRPQVSPDAPTLVQGSAFGVEDPTGARLPPPPSVAPQGPVSMVPPPAAASAPPPPVSSPAVAPPAEPAPAAVPPRWGSARPIDPWSPPPPSPPSSSPPPPSSSRPAAGADASPALDRGDEDEVLFGGSDAGLFAALGRAPDRGLFAPGAPTADAPTVAAPTADAPAPAEWHDPYDPADWDDDEPRSSPAPAAPAPPPPSGAGIRRDPGPPSLVPPAPVRPAGPVAPVDDPYGEPAEDPPSFATDARYPDIPWRDA